MATRSMHAARTLAGDRLAPRRASDSLSAEAQTKVIEGPDLPEGWIGVDIGPSTAASYKQLIDRAGTVVWNGPVGKFEDEPFRLGTLGVAEAMGASKATTVVGGGETAEAVEQERREGQRHHRQAGEELAFGRVEALGLARQDHRAGSVVGDEVRELGPARRGKRQRKV